MGQGAMGPSATREQGSRNHRLESSQAGSLLPNLNQTSQLSSVGESTVLPYEMGLQSL